MADCSKCKRKRADAAHEVELTNDQKVILFALEAKDTHYHKLIKWICAVFAVVILAICAINMYAWTLYDYTGEEMVVDGGVDGIANYVGKDGVIINGENNSTETNQNP